MSLHLKTEVRMERRQKLATSFNEFISYMRERGGQGVKGTMEEIGEGGKEGGMREEVHIHCTPEETSH